MPIHNYKGPTLPTTEWKCPACGNTNVHDVDDGCLHCHGTGKIAQPVSEAARQGKALDASHPPVDAVEDYLAKLRETPPPVPIAIPTTGRDHQLTLSVTEFPDGRALCTLSHEGHSATAKGESTIAAFAAAWEQWQGPILPDAKLEEWLAIARDHADADPDEMIDLFHEIARYARLSTD